MNLKKTSAKAAQKMAMEQHSGQTDKADKQQLFDEQYHQWYDKFEKEDGLKEGAKVRYIGINDKNAEGKPLKVGGRVRYIGLEDEVLVSGNTYEVEGLLLHHYGCGFVSVKLVGIENIYERSMFERVEVTTNKI